MGTMFPDRMISCPDRHMSHAGFVQPVPLRGITRYPFETPVVYHAAAPHESVAGRSGVLAITLVKTLLGGLAVGYIGSRLMGVKAWPMIVTEMALGLSESLAIGKIYNAREGVAGKTLETIHRMKGRPAKPASRITAAERSDSLALLSGIVTGISACIFAGAGLFYSKIGGKTGHAMPDPGVIRKQLAHAAPGAGKWMLQLRLKLAQWGKAPFIQTIRRSPVLSMLVTALAGLVFGWAEGIVAHRLSEPGHSR